MIINRAIDVDESVVRTCSSRSSWRPEFALGITPTTWLSVVTSTGLAEKLASVSPITVVLTAAIAASAASSRLMHRRNCPATPSPPACLLVPYDASQKQFNGPGLQF